CYNLARSARSRATPSQTGARSRQGAIPNGHRQSQELPCGEANSPAACNPSHTTIRQQSHRGFAPTDSDEGTTNASIQVLATSSAFQTIHSVVHNLFRVGRHLLRSTNHRLLRSRSFEVWRKVMAA